jgi:predicted small integral membrane protein
MLEGHWRMMPNLRFLGTAWEQLNEGAAPKRGIFPRTSDMLRGLRRVENVLDATAQPSCGFGRAPPMIRFSGSHQSAGIDKTLRKLMFSAMAWPYPFARFHDFIDAYN